MSPPRSLVLSCAFACALAAMPRPARAQTRHSPGAPPASDTSAIAARSAAAHDAAFHAALQPAYLLAHLKLFADPDLISGLRMRSVETWTPAGGVPTVDRAAVFFYRTVEMELPNTDDGRPISARELHRAELANDRARAAINQAWSGPESSGRLLEMDNQIVDLGSLLRSFEWRAAGVSSFLGRPCVEYHFTPRAGAPDGSRAEKFMAAMEGNLWFDPVSGQVLRVEFHNLRPVRFGFGLLASFHEITGGFDMQPDGGGWVWGDLRLSIRGREMWWSKSGGFEKKYLIVSAGRRSLAGSGTRERREPSALPSK